MIISSSITIFCLHLWLVSSQDSSQDCQMCVEIASKTRQSSKTELEKATKIRALEGMSGYTTEENRAKYKKELLCHWNKYYGDGNNNAYASPMSTCADLGKCASSTKSALTFVDIRNSTKNYYVDNCNTLQAIVLHHTVTSTPEATLTALNTAQTSVQYIVAKNGTIYKMVDEWLGAWHAGVGDWRDMHSLNLNSVGIEIVSDGHSVFPAAQIKAVIALVTALKSRWFVKNYNIVAHHDITPERKDDVSGYFPWQQLYTSLGIYSGLYNTTLSVMEQKTVLISPCSYDDYTLNRVQEGLFKYGYTHLPMTSRLVDDNMLLNMESFNRHFCPEVFTKELFNATRQANIRNPVNQQWFGVSDERLTYLLGQM